MDKRTESISLNVVDPFFSFLLRPAPTSTLFPYTTLFRSYAELTWGGITSEYASDAFMATYPYDKRVRAMETFGDRKSTRLNSSHPSISYAVFCVKKKKTTKNKT